MQSYSKTLSVTCKMFIILKGNLTENAHTHWLNDSMYLYWTEIIQHIRGTYQHVSKSGVTLHEVLLVPSLLLPTILFLYHSHQTLIFKNLYIHTCHLWISPGFHWNVFFTITLKLMSCDSSSSFSITIQWSTEIEITSLLGAFTYNTAQSSTGPHITLWSKWYQSSYRRGNTLRSSCLIPQTTVQGNTPRVSKCQVQCLCYTNGWSWNSCTCVLYRYFSII